MLDGYGDGWNGGNLEVFVNDQSIGTFYANAFGSYETFTVCNNDKIELKYSSGDYEEENSYQLLDDAYKVIFHDEFGPNTGSVFSSTLICGSNTTLQGSHPCLAIAIDTIDCTFSNNIDFPGSQIYPNCSLYQGSDIWFALPTPKSGNLSISVDNGSLQDISLMIWSANDCSNLRMLSCNSGNEGSVSSTIYNVEGISHVLIQVFGYDGAAGTFDLCVKDLGSIKLTESELPIVMINTLGQSIQNDQKIDCKMDIIYNGPNAITYTSDSSNVYSGNIGIEIRGASSSGYPQTPYGFETRDEFGQNNDVSLLDMPAENDWVLLSNFNDRSLMRNALAFKLFEEMGNYSVRANLCEVLIDSNYRGIYLLGEKIKRDKNRVNIATLTGEDVSGDEVTGGYILQQNYWNNENSFQSNYSPIDHPGLDIHFVYEYPEPGAILPEQKTYIASYVDSLETALYSNDFDDEENGYRKYLDVPSFIDYFLVNELARNGDGFKKSVFFNKDKNSNGGKLKAGPVWDFDWAWKNMWGCYIYESTEGAGWAHLNNDCNTDNYSCGYYVRLLQDESFANELRCTYEKYRTTMLDTNYIFSYMDSLKNMVYKAQERHFKKWPILGISGPAPELGPIAQTYSGEIDTLKNWIKTRLNWLDKNIPGTCEISSVNSNSRQIEIQSYPNPASNQLMVEIKNPWAANLEIRILNYLGEQVYFNTINQYKKVNQQVIDLSGIPIGMYLLEVKTKDSKTYKKIMIYR